MIEEDYTFQCPYCWAGNSLRLEPSSGRKQKFSYDCEVCCRSIQIQVEFDGDEVISFSADTEE